MVGTLSAGRLVELDAGHNVPLDRPSETAREIVRAATAVARRA